MVSHKCLIVTYRVTRLLFEYKIYKFEWPWIWPLNVAQGHINVQLDVHIWLPIKQSNTNHMSLTVPVLATRKFFHLLSCMGLARTGTGIYIYVRVWIMFALSRNLKLWFIPPFFSPSVTRRHKVNSELHHGQKVNRLKDDTNCCTSLFSNTTEELNRFRFRQLLFLYSPWCSIISIVITPFTFMYTYVTRWEFFCEHAYIYRYRLQSWSKSYIYPSRPLGAFY